MQENTTYSILSPEGFASILWKDSGRAKEASEIMKITAEDLLGYQIIDKVIEEPTGGAQQNPKEAAQCMQAYLVKTLEELCEKDVDTLLEERYERFRKYGQFL